METIQHHQVNILLADDDQDERYFFGRALTELPFEHHLVAVHDGELLMKYLLDSANTLPDIIFLDLNMPKKSGWECLAEIKGNAAISQIPIVIYSNMLDEDIADSLFAKGAHYFMLKCEWSYLPKCIETVITLLKANKAHPARAEFVIDLKKIMRLSGLSSPSWRSQF